jgi:hypothetical protein
MLASAVLDLPYALPPDAAQPALAALDVEGKIPRAFESLGPVNGRDVILVGGPDGVMAGGLATAGARVVATRFVDGRLPRPTGSADAVVAGWDAFRGVVASELAEADRVLRPNGRLLVLHDYGRDDVSRLRPADLPEYTSWSRRDGPFLRAGFKLRVVHCFWSWGSLEEARAALEGLGDAGAALAAGLHRPRATWNLAIYHRWRHGRAPEPTPALAVPTAALRPEGSVA